MVNSREAVIFSTIPPAPTAEGELETQTIAGLTKILESENYHVTVYRSSWGMLPNGQVGASAGTATLANFIFAGRAGVLVISSHGSDGVTMVEAYDDKTQWDDAIAKYRADKFYGRLSIGLANESANAEFYPTGQYLIGLPIKTLKLAFGNSGLLSQDRNHLVFNASCESSTVQSAFPVGSYFGYVGPVDSGEALPDLSQVFERLAGTVGNGSLRTTQAAYYAGGFSGPLIYRSVLPHSVDGLVLSPAVSLFSSPPNSGATMAGPFKVHFDSAMDTSIRATRVIQSSALVENARWLSSTALLFDLKRPNGCSNGCGVKGLVLAKKAVAAGPFPNWLDGDRIAPNGFNYDFTFTFK
jgi:hypothetical protein